MGWPICRCVFYNKHEAVRTVHARNVEAVAVQLQWLIYAWTRAYIYKPTIIGPEVAKKATWVILSLFGPFLLSLVAKEVARMVVRAA